MLIAVFILVYHYIPSYGQTHIMCYIGVCSLVGSLSVCIISCVYFFTSWSWYTQLSYLVQIFFFQVMSVKAIGIALKLTLSGMNQLVFPQTWAFTFIVLLCIITQMNYLNKVITPHFFCQNCSLVDHSFLEAYSTFIRVYIYTSRIPVCCGGILFGNSNP